LLSPQYRSSASEVKTIRFSAVPIAIIFPPITSILASFSLTITPGFIVSTDRTETFVRLITYTFPASHTVGSLIVPETAITLQCCASCCSGPTSCFSQPIILNQGHSVKIFSIVFVAFYFSLTRTKVKGAQSANLPPKRDFYWL